MRYLFVKTLPLWLSLFVFTAQGQMSEPRPIYRSEKSDSAYVEKDVESPKDKANQTVKIIKKEKLMPDGTYKPEPLHGTGHVHASGAVADSPQVADQTAPQDTAAPVAAAPDTAVTAPSVADTAVSTSRMYLLYGALCLLGLALLLAALLLLLGGRDKKRSPFISMVQGVCATVGFILLLSYCICLSALVTSVVILLLAALTGTAILTNDVYERPNPMWLVGTHIVLMLTGIVMLVMAAFMH